LDGFKTDSGMQSKNRSVSKARSTNGITPTKKKQTIHSGIADAKYLDVFKKYTKVEELGRGSMGEVTKVTLNGSVRNANKSMQGGQYALKTIQLDRVSRTFLEELMNEVDILNTMDHPNIVKLREVISHEKQIFMVLELCDGGDLYSRLPYTEKEAAYITGKMLSAVKYMHDHQIVHRDLKFENIMFESKNPGAEIKVIDFGLSKKFISSKLGIMREGCGTLYSMAPQVLQGVYTSQADMWSTGVITYMLLSSHRPFYSKTRKVMIDKIMRCEYSFTKDYWKTISDEALDYISNLLVMNPKIRYNAQRAQAHKWMHKEFNIEDRAPTVSTTKRVTSTLSAYKNNLPLKKLALNVIAHRSTTDEIFNLRKAFDQFDVANNGVISSEEFKLALHERCSYTEIEIKEMFDAIDINQNGHIMYTEFIAATLEAQGQLDEDRIKESFDRLDVDETGFISKENMLEFLADTGASMEDVDNMIKDADTDDCGQVSYDEFLAMFRSEDLATSSNLRNSLKCYHFGDIVPTETSADSTETENKKLVGLDAVIPGGRYDAYV